MRLICPNCDAQYEVPTDIMPIEGRDVQCSNCGYTWFQTHPDAPDTSPESVALQDEEVVTDIPTPDVTTRLNILNTPNTEDETDLEADAAKSQTVSQEPSDPDPDMAGTEDAPPDKAAQSDAPQRRELDPAVADVLRAEAELEEQARRREMAGLESQPELGLSQSLDDAKRRAEQARQRMAQMRGEGQETASPDSAKATNDAVNDPIPAPSRRDLLPDIEEINSTLRSNSDRSPASDPGQTAQLEIQEKRNARRGFAVMVAMIAIMVLIYAFAPQMGDAVPQAKQPLAAYVEAVDTGRVWIDERVAQMLGWLDQTAQSSGG